MRRSVRRPTPIPMPAGPAGSIRTRRLAVRIAPAAPGARDPAASTRMFRPEVKTSATCRPAGPAASTRAHRSARELTTAANSKRMFRQEFSDRRLAFNKGRAVPHRDLLLRARRAAGAVAAGTLAVEAAAVVAGSAAEGAALVAAGDVDPRPSNKQLRN